MLLALLLLLAPVTGFSSSPNDVAFQTGIRLTQESKFAEAAQQFETEFKSGKNFSALFYNWALVAYKQQRFGLSVALLRRALYMAPDLAPARRALNLALSHLPAQQHDEDLSFWSSLRVNLLDRFSLNKVLFVTWLFFILSGYLLIRYWGHYRQAIKNVTPLPKPPALGVVFAAAFLLFVFLSIAKGVSDREIRATVINTPAALRTGPSQEDNPIFDLSEGLEVSILQVQNSWAHVSLSSGATGWLPTSELFQNSGQVQLW